MLDRQARSWLEPLHQFNCFKFHRTMIYDVLQKWLWFSRVLAPEQVWTFNFCLLPICCKITFLTSTSDLIPLWKAFIDTVARCTKSKHLITALLQATPVHCFCKNKFSLLYTIILMMCVFVCMCVCAHMHACIVLLQRRQTDRRIVEESSFYL
jgi:hypothetical protein